MKRPVKTIDPLYRLFMGQRCGAKRRGIPWEMPYWEWLMIWQESGHLPDRGHRDGQWVMARNKDLGPYARYNVKIVRCNTNNSDAARGRVMRRKLTAEAQS